MIMDLQEYLWEFHKILISLPVICYIMRTIISFRVNLIKDITEIYDTKIYDIEIQDTKI